MNLSSDDVAYTEMSSILEELYVNDTTFNSSILVGSGESLFEEVINTTIYSNQQVADIRKRIFTILIPVVLSFCLISFFLSLSVVCSIPFIKRPMSPTIRLSLSLSAANSTFSLIVFIASTIHTYLPTVFNIHLHNCIQLTVEAIRLGVILVQVYHLVAVALVHYFGTLRPLKYASTLTPLFLKVVIFFLWILPVMGIFVIFSSIPGQGYQSPGCTNNHFRLNGSMFRYVWSCLFFVPTVLLFIVYTHIFYLLRKREVHVLSRQQQKLQSKNYKTLKTTAMIVVMFFIGWVPAVLAFMIVCKDCIIQVTDVRISIAIFSSAYILFILKVCVDTLIYALRLPEIREAMKAMLSYTVAVLFCRPEAKDRRHFRSRFSSTFRSTYFSTSSQRERSLRGHSSIKNGESLKINFEMESLTAECHVEIPNSP